MFSIDVMFEGPEICAHGREVRALALAARVQFRLGRRKRRERRRRKRRAGPGRSCGGSSGGRRRRKQHGRLNAAPLHYVPPLHHVRNRSALSSASADS